MPLYIKLNRIINMLFFYDEVGIFSADSVRHENAQQWELKMAPRYPRQGGSLTIIAPVDKTFRTSEIQTDTHPAVQINY